MTTQVLLPKLGFAMNDGKLLEWLVADGDTVAEGAPLFILESEKSATEVEAPAAGVLCILAATGETYQVGTVLGVIE